MVSTIYLMHPLGGFVMILCWCRVVISQSWSIWKTPLEEWWDTTYNNVGISEIVFSVRKSDEAEFDDFVVLCRAAR